ncbi:MAG: hypothetical protein MHMPM18_002032 [Marteilia pararefringens]
MHIKILRIASEGFLSESLAIVKLDRRSSSKQLSHSAPHCGDQSKWGSNAPD